MPSLAKNLPTTIMLAIQAAIFLAVNRGIFTAEQALALSALLGTGAVPVMHRMAPPAPKDPPPPSEPPKRITLTTGGLVLLALGLVGCGSFEEARTAHAAQSATIGATPRPTDYCRSLDNQQRWGGTLAAGFAIVGGGSGAAAAFDDDKDRRTAAAIAALSSAIISAGSTWLSHDAGKSWARDCQ